MFVEHHRSAESWLREIARPFYLINPLFFFFSFSKFPSMYHFARFYYVEYFIVVKALSLSFALSFNEHVFYIAFFLPAFFSFPILQLHYYIVPQRAMCFSGSYLRSLNFKLITTLLLARQACLVIFTLFVRGPFYLACFFLPFLSFPPTHRFGCSVSPLLRYANIIKLSRLYYYIAFLFLSPPLR